jgi:selenocysteine lyase/cysteine desulfurase
VTEWSAIREEFPALARWTYLNTATYGQMPRRSVEAMARYAARRDEMACTDFLDWYEDVDRLRASLARLIHAAPEDIAFVPNAAAALSMVLAGIALAPGDNVVTLDDDFPNFQYVNAARKSSWEGFYDAVDDRTRLVALSEVNYATGFRPPLADISRFARERGVPLFVDGSQSIGALTFDVTKTPVDAMAVHGYKWMISPTGAGFLYVSPALRARLPARIVGWRSHHDWRNVDRLHHGIPEFTETAEKYEGGGLPFHLLYSMQASVDWMIEIGVETIERRVLELARATRDMLCRLGAAVAETGSQIVCAEFPKQDASQLARVLRESNVIVAARHGRLRVSPHFYNSEEDLRRLEVALRAM